MSKSAKRDAVKFANFLKSLPEAVRAEGNKRQKERAEAEHREFQERFRSGNCYLCNQALTSFDRSKPCAH